MTATRIHTTGQFGFRDWQEQAYSEIQGGSKLANARVTNTYQGDIVGEGTAQYLLVYVDGTNGTYTGLEQVTGTLGGRTGSFVLEHSGTFDATSVRARLAVVADSGSGDLKGISGTGSFAATHGTPETPYTLDVQLP